MAASLAAICRVTSASAAWSQHQSTSVPARHGNHKNIVSAVRASARRSRRRRAQPRATSAVLPAPRAEHGDAVVLGRAGAARGPRRCPRRARARAAASAPSIAVIFARELSTHQGWAREATATLKVRAASSVCARARPCAKRRPQPPVWVLRHRRAATSTTPEKHKIKHKNSTLREEGPDVLSRARPRCRSRSSGTVVAAGGRPAPRRRPRRRRAGRPPSSERRAPCRARGALATDLAAPRPAARGRRPAQPPQPATGKATTPDAASTASTRTSARFRPSTTSRAATTCVASSSSKPPAGSRSPAPPGSGPRDSHTTPPCALRTCTSPPNATVFTRSASPSFSATLREVGRFRQHMMTVSCCTAMTWTTDLCRNWRSSRKSAAGANAWHVKTTPGVTSPLSSKIDSRYVSSRCFLRAASASAVIHLRRVQARGDPGPEHLVVKFKA